MTHPTPPDGTSTVIAGQLARDEGQDRDLRQLRRSVAVGVAVALIALCAALAALLRRPSPPPLQSPTVHVAACPAAPACPASPPCAACPACPQPTPERHHR